MPQRTPIGTRLEIQLDEEYLSMQNNWFFKWHFIGRDGPVEIESFNGKSIKYEGVKFWGTTEQVYWETIQRYLRKKINELFDALEVDLAACDMAERRVALSEAHQLIRRFAARIRQATSEKDRILRGNGVEFPQIRHLGSWRGSGDHDIQQRVEYLERTVCRPRLTVEGIEMVMDPTDKVNHAKQDGTVVKENVPAFVTAGKVITWDTSLPLEIGDHLLRQLPNGFVEDFIIEDPTYFSDIGGIGAHYQVKVRRSDRPAAPPSTVINNITGDHARIYVHSVDASKTTISQNDAAVFKELAATIQTHVKGQEQKAVLERLAALEAASGSASFKDRYQEFVASAAAHMTIIAPFLPALTKML